MSDARVLIVGAGLLAAGTAGFLALEPSISDPVDALYLAGMTLTTIGFGDLGPTTPTARAFFALYSLLGLGFFGLCIESCGKLRTAALDGRVVNTVVGANAWFQALVLGLWTVAAGTFMLMSVEPGTFKDPQETAYFCVVAGTTVGYGDVSPQTPAGKVAVTVYALFALQVFADVTGLVGDALKGFVCGPAATGKDGKEL